MCISNSSGSQRRQSPCGANIVVSKKTLRCSHIEPSTKTASPHYRLRERWRKYWDPASNRELTYHTFSFGFWVPREAAANSSVLRSPNCVFSRVSDTSTSELQRYWKSQTSAVGHKQTFCSAHPTSAVPSKRTLIDPVGRSASGHQSDVIVQSLFTGARSHG